MASLYDMNNLYRLQRDTGDAPIGNPAIPPSRVLAAWARTLARFGSTAAPGGDGTAFGVWPNQLVFTWSGERIGGTLGAVSAAPGGGDPLLYDTGKATLPAGLLRAAGETGDPALAEMGAGLTRLALDAALADDSPLGKVQGLYLARLPAAVALLAPPPAAGPDRADFNGDGTSDIAVFRDTSGLWAVRRLTRVYFGRAGDSPVPADYNGDGTAEIGIFRETTGLWGVRDLYRAYFGTGGDLPLPGDYDGDGTTEIGIFRESSGLWAVRGVTRVYFGGAGDAPVPGRYDGDTAKDIGLFRGSSGLWTLRGISRVYFGGAADMTVPGDYDGGGMWEAGYSALLPGYGRSGGLPGATSGPAPTDRSRPIIPETAATTSPSSGIPPASGRSQLLPAAISASPAISPSPGRQHRHFCLCYMSELCSLVYYLIIPRAPASGLPLHLILYTSS